MARRDREFSMACRYRRAVLPSSGTGRTDRMTSTPDLWLVSMPTITTPPSSALQKRLTASAVEMVPMGVGGRGVLSPAANWGALVPGRPAGATSRLATS
jgi:hypothetical protein